MKALNLVGAEICTLRGVRIGGNLEVTQKERFIIWLATDFDETKRFGLAGPTGDEHTRQQRTLSQKYSSNNRRRQIFPQDDS